MFWDHYVRLCAEKGVSPSFVCKELSLSNATATHWKKGATPSSVTLQKIADYFGVSTSVFQSDANDLTHSSTLHPLSKQGVHLLPVYESVSAGFGAAANDLIIDYMPCYIRSEAEAAESLCIKVKGDSMYPKIEDGDIIRVLRCDSVDSGCVAVVLVDGEDALVKKIVYGHNFIELHSFNPLYPVLRFENQDVLRVRVIGQVKQVVKNI